MSNLPTNTDSPAYGRPARRRKTRSRLHNFGRGIRWIVRSDGEAFGSHTSSHDSLARCAGYKNAEQAYANGALRAHYDPATNAIRIESAKASAEAVSLARQIIERVPAALAHVAFGEGEEFRSYIGRPREVAAEISSDKVPYRLQIHNLPCPGAYESAA